MSVDLLPILIDEKTLQGEILRLSKALPPEKIDHWETVFHEALFYEPGSDRNQYAYGKLQPYNNTKWCFDADKMRFRLVRKARETGDADTERSADALYQFFGAFFCGRVTYNPFNEYGFSESVIMSPGSSRRFHLLFQQIQFELLEPVFEQECRVDDDGEKFGYIQSFKDLLDYAKALDGLLVQAIEAKKMLYVYVNC